jgi:beta-galactosidase/beta-glucuronidase
MKKTSIIIISYLIVSILNLSGLNAQDKNLALNKAAYHSSCINFDNTAHLATNGDYTIYNNPILSSQYSDSPPEESIEKAFDGSFETKFLTFNKTGWIQCSFKYNKKYTVNKYSITSANDSPGRDPRDWTLQGSNDDDNWVTLDTRSNITFTGRKYTRTYPFTNPTAYNSYRLNITKNGGADELQFAELSLYENDVNIVESRLSSEWISKSGASEWIYVDLGAVCDINKIKLHWGGGYAEAYSIQLSNNAKDWQSVYNTTSGDGEIDEINVSASGRYVRMNASKLGASDSYSLVEFEVYGTGENRITPAPQPEIQADGTLYLTGGNWKLQRANFVSPSGNDISKANFDDSDWIIATVPGTVLTGYLNIGAIPDPNYGDQQLQISDAYFTADFWYRNSFIVPDSYSGKHIFLHFDGINWKADIYVNGQNAGRIEGAFIRGKFDITNYVTPGETAYIAVYIHKNDTPGSVSVQTSASAGPNGGALGADNPTIHASVGWDWLPTIRGRNTGIQDNVFLSASKDVSIKDPFVITKLPLPDTQSADLSITVDLQNNTSANVSGILKGAINPGNRTFTQNVSLNASELKTVTLDKSLIAGLSIENPQLWWPNGYGEQFMYDLSLTFEAGGVVSDTKTVPFGIREITTTTDNDVLTVFVNGKRIFLRGGNWGLSESMLRLDEEGYDNRVRLHKEENFTMIRNWVGQTGSDYFYRACDKYGILIWDDFWLANPGDGPDPNDPNMFMNNARDKIKRVRNHPSVALYCGRNEGFPPESLNTALENAVASLDGTRIYIPHSADKLVTGYGYYSIQDPKSYFLRNTPRMHTEMGMPNVPSLESMQAMLPEDKQWPINEMWGIHDYCNSIQKADDYTKAVNKYGNATSLQDFCLKAQMVNMVGHKAMFESFTACKSNGLLMWMSQSAWPSTVWQTYDYYLEQTAGYYGCKKATEPLHILWDYNSNWIKIANNTGIDYTGLVAKVSIYNMDGTLKYSNSADAMDLPQDMVKDCFKLTYPNDLSAVHFIHLQLMKNDRLLSDNFYWRGRNYQEYETLSEMEKVTLTGTIDKSDKASTHSYTVQISNPTNKVAVMIRLKMQRASSGERVLPVFYSDNYFSLVPNESKTITLEFDSKYLDNESPKLMVEGWNINPFEVTELVGIEEIDTDNLSFSVVISPNPTDKMLFIRGIKDFDVEVFDLAGIKVLQRDKQNNSIDISSLTQGTYIIKLSNKEKTVNQKIIKR